MADFDKALEGAEKRQTEERLAFHRAVLAAKAKKSLDLREQAMLETFPEDQRGAVLAFVRWSAGQKWRGGPMVKLAAKASFVQAWLIFQAAYLEPTEEQKTARDKIAAPGDA